MPKLLLTLLAVPELGIINLLSVNIYLLCLGLYYTWNNDSTFKADKIMGRQREERRYKGGKSKGRESGKEREGEAGWRCELWSGGNGPDDGG